MCVRVSRAVSDLFLNQKGQGRVCLYVQMCVLACMWATLLPS
jgi:hypothetical protein